MTADEVAQAVGLPGSSIWPPDGYRAVAGNDPNVTRMRGKQVREFDQIALDAWLKRRGQGRKLPEAPVRKVWRDQMELQSANDSGWLVANYGHRLMLLDSREGWLSPLGISADEFIVVPEIAGPTTSAN